MCVADEHGSGVDDARGDSIGVGGLDLEVLGGVGVGDVDGLVDVAYEHGRRLLAGESRTDALGVLGDGDLRLQLDIDLVGERLAVGDQHAGRHRVVLGLADQVGRDERGVGCVVGDDRDLGRTGLGIDADDALQVTLGGRDVDVARAR